MRYLILVLLLSGCANLGPKISAATGCPKDRLTYQFEDIGLVTTEYTAKCGDIEFICTLQQPGVMICSRKL